jgi:hypothetical protein
VSTGLRDAGFTYVNIDAGSLQRTRGRDGKIAPDHAKFPRGMRYLADHLHSMGLRLGVLISSAHPGMHHTPSASGRSRERCLVGLAMGSVAEQDPTVAGVYTDISDGSCGTGPGSKDHYTQDAQTFAHDWQIE